MGADAHRKQRNNKGPQFVQLFNYVIDSPAYRGLSSSARAALVEFARLYNGRNNGQLTNALDGFVWRVWCSTSIVDMIRSEQGPR